MRSYGALEVLGLGLRVLEGFMELYELLWVLATPIIIVTMTRMMIYCGDDDCVPNQHANGMWLWSLRIEDLSLTSRTLTASF